MFSYPLLYKVMRPVTPWLDFKILIILYKQKNTIFFLTPQLYNMLRLYFLIQII
ncbi:hypothetical protein BACI71_40579 [Bacillus mycoides]|uniref:Uncharacterized protein n=1 Tax=Bacillus mycoides TaxID=1405 RepID=A0A654AAR6_BACMY|nr:hypothetical protein BACI71_40579 [Bacillus mycoides]